MPKYGKTGKILLRRISFTPQWMKKLALLSIWHQDNFNCKKKMGAFGVIIDTRQAMSKYGQKSQKCALLAYLMFG